ncbi:MAG: hypothetical protein E1N59_2936 [Puniceicoccaceae bacterium 5H]|nr:MAG: hypothetical protein E1N59_2936 [Puniceicoccaceae bacterium 5H]
MKLLLRLVCLLGLIVYGLLMGYVLIDSAQQPLIGYDLVRDAQNAAGLLESGQIPTHGGVNSYFSLNVPGVAYGIALGGLFEPDNVAQAERWGGVLMMLGTALALVLWLRRYWGWTWALLVGFVFLSFPTGWFYGMNLWPRAHPLFLVLLLWSLDAWSARGNRWALGAAVLVYLAGCFWMLEFLPAVLLFGVAWIVRRPPLAWKQGTLGLALGLLLWWPYLHFEHQRGWVDLQSMFAQKMPPGVSFTPRDALGRDDVQLVSTAQETDEEAPPGKWMQSETWGKLWAQTVLSVHEGRVGYWYCRFPNQEWFFQSVEGEVYRKATWSTGGELLQTASKERVAEAVEQNRRQVHLLEVPLVANFQPYPSRFFPWLWTLWTLLALAVWPAGRWWYGKTEPEQEARWPFLALTLTCAVLLPLVMFFLISDDRFSAYNYRRFYWFWPAQAILLVALPCTLWRILASRRRGVAAGLVAGASLLLVAGGLLHGYRGFGWLTAEKTAQNDLRATFDDLARELEQSGEDSVQLGYEITFEPHQLAWHNADPFYKVGRDLDVSLLWLHGIENTNGLAEALSPEDTYRIREKPSTNQKSYRIQEAERPEFEVVTEHGVWQLLKRVTPVAAK